MKSTLLILLAATTMACGEVAPKKTAAQIVSDSISTADSLTRLATFQTIRSNSLNQTARFIAGIDCPADSLFALRKQSRAWQCYAKDADLDWAEFHAKNQNMEQWVQTNVVPRSCKIQSVIYPFSGPDFLHLNIFFPQAKSIYMLGLEPIGSVPKVNKIDTMDLEKYVDMYRQAIAEITEISYYRTKSMFEDVNNFSIDGVSPVVMIFLARSGKYLLSVDSMTLSDQGVPISARGMGHTRNRGVKITYRTESDTTMRELLFFTGDIEDPALERNTARRKFIESISCQGGFSKSASYLMHHKSFSTIRNTMLRNCQFIVQDDTGIAFKFFDPKQWDIELYGTYTKPINDFKYIFEKKLKEAYNDSSRVVKPLDFRFGYNRKSNMRIATKKLN
ncbi:MAG: hypothetical protein RR066_05915 [Mucinivorans sp.]